MVSIGRVGNATPSGVFVETVSLSILIHSPGFRTISNAMHVGITTIYGILPCLFTIVPIIASAEFGGVRVTYPAIDDVSITVFADCVPSCEVLDTSDDGVDGGVGRESWGVGQLLGQHLWLDLLVDLSTVLGSGLDGDLGHVVLIILR